MIFFLEAFYFRSTFFHLQNRTHKSVGVMNHRLYVKMGDVTDATGEAKGPVSPPGGWFQHLINMASFFVQREKVSSS